MIVLKSIVENNASFVLYNSKGSNQSCFISGELKKTSSPIVQEQNFVVADYEGQTYTFENFERQKLAHHSIKEKINDVGFFTVLDRNQEIKSTAQESYIKQVHTGIDSIEKGELHKIVFSRTKVSKNHMSSILDAYMNLTTTYPEGFVCLFYDKKLGCWLGASPELLLQSTEDQVKTVALAGTQLAMNKTIKQAAWSQKEIEEQALVSRYIINCFKKIRLREYEEKGPKTIQTGQLFHLKTEFNINKKETDITDIETQLLALIHPTSAVCGMPKEKAKTLLSSTEEHERKLYTGFWGPTSTTGFDFYVNIRLAQIFQNHIVYYAGAGITEDSTPEAEWTETEAKCDNLALKLLD